MTDTMRERVARAIADAYESDLNEAGNLFVAMADAAIATMREPTDYMMDQTIRSHGAEPQDDMWDDPIARQIYDDWLVMWGAAWCEPVERQHDSDHE